MPDTTSALDAFIQRLMENAAHTSQSVDASLVKNVDLLLKAQTVMWITRNRKRVDNKVVGHEWSTVLKMLLRSRLPFTDNEFAELAIWLADHYYLHPKLTLLPEIVALLEHRVASASLSRSLIDSVTILRTAVLEQNPNREGQRIAARLNAILDNTHPELIPGGKPIHAQDFWRPFVNHCQNSSSAKPSAKWNATAKQYITSIGVVEASSVVADWFHQVSAGDSATWAFTSKNDVTPSAPFEDCLKGLAWATVYLPTSDICRALGHLCDVALKKLPGIGPRMPSLANAAVYALGQLTDGPASEAALGQLSRLKARIIFRTTLKQLEKALESAAQRKGMSRADLEELGVPTYGFSPDSTRIENFGDARAELCISANKVTTTWYNARGKPVKAPPAEIKTEHAAALKDLKATVADAEKMLTAQRDRLDNLMGSPKTWTVANFRARYLEHPIVGALARRLIWTLDATPVLFIDGKPADVLGNIIEHGASAEIALWHPVTRPTADILAWRNRLAQLQITQPFKQVHRELYILTDAERTTATYSNRFAAHILKQHQFNALAALRGWKNKLRLLVDDTYPPASKELPEFNLRAEFWIEGAGDNYGTDTNETGVFHRVSTDQVRFYHIDAAQLTAHAGGGGYGSNYRQEATPQPLPLEQIPPLVFSEIMRDVDLFVGVCSVANDPAWSDGGPDGRFRNYWHETSFGDLSASANTRKEVLANLLPRLAIAPQCSLSEKFLLVKGSKRTYKIHLGSGNILMEPNDQYLCIVPNASARAASPNLFLPFEGDSTLSIILSKAFLLAADHKITDPTILPQIS